MMVPIIVKTLIAKVHSQKAVNTKPKSQIRFLTSVNENKKPVLYFNLLFGHDYFMWSTVFWMSEGFKN